jgi:hypothetical protein
VPRAVTSLLVVPFAIAGCADFESSMMGEYGSAFSASVKAPCEPYAVFEKDGKLLAWDCPLSGHRHIDRL